MRTKKGQIDKFIKCDSIGFVKCENSNYWLEDIVNHSKNLKDLIKEGDYVNDCIVSKDCGGLLLTDEDGDFDYLKDIDIETIVTKEQFESIEYKV